MINPDSELRLFSALQASGETEEDKQRKQKIIKDLIQGFRIVKTAPNTDRVFVVTRNGTDLFNIELGIDHLIATPQDPDAELKTFLYCDTRITRSTTLWPDGDTLDSWEAHVSEATPLNQSFSPSGLQRERISAQEFWSRYNESMVDPKATRDLLRKLTSSGFNNGYQVTWVSKELPV